jgi:hypothetical protein
MERKFEAVYGRMIKVDRLGEICCDGGRELSGFCRSSAHVERKERQCKYPQFYKENDLSI